MERRDECKNARFKGTAEGASPGQDVASGCLMAERAMAMAMAAVDAAMGYCSGRRRRGRESGQDTLLCRTDVVQEMRMARGTGGRPMRDWVAQELALVWR